MTPNPTPLEVISFIVATVPEVIEAIHKIAAVDPHEAATPEGRERIVSAAVAIYHDAIPGDSVPEATFEPVLRVSVELLVHAIVQAHKNAATRATAIRRRIARRFPSWATDNDWRPSKRADKTRIAAMLRNLGRAEKMAEKWGQP